MTTTHELGLFLIWIGGFCFGLVAMRLYLLYRCSVAFKSQKATDDFVRWLKEYGLRKIETEKQFYTALWGMDIDKLKNKNQTFDPPV